jgi:hypothetical protein
MNTTLLLSAVAASVQPLVTLFDAHPTGAALTIVLVVVVLVIGRRDEKPPSASK